MNMDSQTQAILVVVLVLVVLGIVAWIVSRKKQSKYLQQRFGPEYAHAVDELGSKSKGESELKAREVRVEHLHIVALPAAEAAWFGLEWKALQGRFVDNPKGVLAQADQLVRELMGKRGYPMADFAHRAADVSVDHPTVVAHYRAAEAIALRDQRGEADTEALRQGVVHYRALFQELLDNSEPRPTAANPVEMHS